MKTILTILIVVMTTIVSYGSQEIDLISTKKSILKSGVKIDFSLSESNLKVPYIKISIGNKSPEICAFDTGSQYDLVIKESAVKKYNLKIEGSGEMRINGEKKFIKYGVIDQYSLIGFSKGVKLEIKDRNFIVLSDDEPIFKSLNYNKKPVDFVASLNTQLDISILQLDYINMTVNFVNHTNDIDLSQCVKNKLIIKNDRPYIELTTGRVKSQFVIDTGLNWVILPYDIVFDFDIKNKKDAELIGVGKFKGDGKFGILDQLKIENMIFKNIRVAWFFGINHGALGYEALKNKIITIDSKTGFVYFEE